MKLGKNKLAIALAAALSFGVVGQASADVYGVSALNIDSLKVAFTNAAPGSGATIFNFATNADAILNGAADLSDGSASCFGVFGGSNTCGAGSPRLSGTAQNAPGSSPIRAESNYTVFGTGTQYSNAEAEITHAVLLGDPATETHAIAESNLISGTSAQANTNVNSTTLLNLTFTLANNGGFTVDFNAAINRLAQLTGADIGHGISLASSSVSVILEDGNGNTIVQWLPNNASVADCAAGVTCVATGAGNLSGTSASSGAPNSRIGSGAYSLDVSGLASGTYTLGLATSTQTNLTRVPVVPVPGTLLLMGTGLLAGARALRRKK